MAVAERVAIVGLAGRFPGSGDDLDLFWDNVVGAVDCSREIPSGRWHVPAESIRDDRIAHPDSVYSTRSYTLDPFHVDAKQIPVPADLLAGLDPLFHLVLDVGSRAWTSMVAQNVDRRKTGVVLGNICLPTDASSDLAREYLGGRVMRAVGRRQESRRTHPWNRYVAGLPAGLLAKAFDFGGGTFTLDAACASSIYAIKLACDELLSHRADAMLAGGVSRPDSLYTQMGFAQLRALSPSGRCSPFDAAADGLVVGEGAGIFVLKRLADALRGGDAIYGVLCGAGLSNDMNGNLLAPAKEGQLRAMRDAYRNAGWKTNFADVIECHATGTPVGDAVEFESLRELWGEDGWKPGQCTIGSVKSTVGHLLTGAGAAALMKVVLALKHRVKPPQANFETPNPNLNYAHGPLRVLTAPEAWDPRRPTLPRRAAVSGFGFGGVNGHLLVEEYVGQNYVQGSAASLLRLPPSTVTPVQGTSRLMTKLNDLMAKHAEAIGSGTIAANDESDASRSPIAVVGLAAHFGPWDNLRSFQEFVLGGSDRPEPFPQVADGAPGHFLENVPVPLDRFRIPPRELEELLPQQLLMLTTAAAALDDSRTQPPGETDDPRTGVFIGLALDLNTTNFHLRWSAKQLAAETLTPEGEAPPAEWVQAVADGVGPPLTADRTMGALGSIAASRIARAFHFGGPSFTVCSEESSAARAVELAVRALRQRDLDRVVVGGVDLAGDIRAMGAADAQRPFSTTGQSGPLEITSDGVLPGEGAAALVLKRLDDAERDGDRVYAVIRGVGAASGGDPVGVAPDRSAYASSLMRACTDAVVDPATVEYLEAAATGSLLDDRPEAEAIGALLQAQNRLLPLNVSAVQGAIGRPGAAAGAAGLVKACLALYQQILPPTIDSSAARHELTARAERLADSREARFWLRDDVAPRRALVASSGIDGSVLHFLLEESTKPVDAVALVDPTADPERLQPLGARSEGLFVIEADTGEELVPAIDRFVDWLNARQDQQPERLAREWFLHVPPNSARKRAATFVARSGAELRKQLLAAQESIRKQPNESWPLGTIPESRPELRDRTFYSAAPLTGHVGPGTKGRVAFVYPGSGNHFAGMGRELAVHWPEVLRKQQSENRRLRSQYAPELFWKPATAQAAGPREFLFGQVTLGTLTSDLLVHLGVKPTAMIGQSLGESAGLFGLRVWRDRDEMYARLQESTLFTEDLAPPYRAARAFYSLPADRPLDWIAGVLTVSAEDVRPALRPGLHAYLLIVATAYECVIGGVEADVHKLVAQFPDANFLPLSGVTLAHCEAAKPVEAAYRELHTLPTATTAISIYSGAYSRNYKPTPNAAADSITAGLLNTIDFPAVIENAYREGVRLFVEVGPGQSASRTIGTILAGRPHLVRSVSRPQHDDVSLVLRTLAALIAERVPVQLVRLYGGPSPVAAHQPGRAAARSALSIPVRRPLGVVPPPPWLVPIAAAETPEETPAMAASEWDDDAPQATQTDAFSDLGFVLPDYERPEASDRITIYDDPATMPAAEPAEGRLGIVVAEAPLEDPTEAIEEDFTTFAEPIDVDTPLVRTPQAVRQSPIQGIPIAQAFVDAAVKSQAAVGDAHGTFLQVQAEGVEIAAAALALQSRIVARLLGRFEDEDGDPPAATVTGEPPRSLTTEQCFTFARGKIADVLGPMFAKIDGFPTRVRLPDGPLMLVDNIRLIEGEPLSMRQGRVVTDHAVHASRWYLDAGRCPTSITVESGQADLFLSGFLGIDLKTEGKAVYRLLDAVVTFHRGLPKIGETIVYDIHVDEFFHQADSWLFRFRFEGSVNGEPLLSMQNGIAGFFTPEALAAGQGIVHTKFDLQMTPGKTVGDWIMPASFGSGEALTAKQVQALQQGDLVGAFGQAFAGVKLHQPLKLPAGRLRLLDRVPVLDPAGGRFGLGFVRGVYDIQPDEWFIACHFIDDPVMPGTLMYECCLHTLRVLLMRMGMIGEQNETACEPVPGVKSRLKCRGQVLQSTATVTYEVSIKEIGYRPEPYAVAEALMLADGKPIVEITNLSLRMSGLSRQSIAEAWGQTISVDVTPLPPGSEAVYDVKPALYDRARILAYSNGKPSEAFGEPYGIFDRSRVLARLPGPPFQFLDRITGVSGEPFVLKAGASCEAQYDVPADAWYFAADRSGFMPFSVLLETALQPCGWLAAYCGSALTSETDVSFRNLGGTAVQSKAVTPTTGTLTTNVTMTQVSNSAGMLIQHYTMKVTNRGGTVYEGTTYFGFFGRDALKNQIGMPTAKLPAFTPEQLASPNFFRGKLPTEAPYPTAMLRMVDDIEGWHPTGGRAGLGLAIGGIAVDPTFWFFQAHFYQDPVWPGSLGLESFLQLGRFVANRCFSGTRAATLDLEKKHQWTYRGQVVPSDQHVRVMLDITAIDSARGTLTADGFLTVDGRIIYQMTGFVLRCE